MQTRELYIKKISTTFARWHADITYLNSLSLYDANVFSENSICNLLNVIFNYSLKNINLYAKNQPAIDLVDNTNKIAIQVTSTLNKAKIQSTLDGFFNYNLDKKYHKLIIIILGNKISKYHKLRVKSGFSFDESTDILDFKGLLAIINRLPTEKISEIAALLVEEFDKPEKSKKNNASRIKRNLMLKKKLKKDFLITLDRKLSRKAIYEPWIRFRYHNVLIRSIDDDSWPNQNEPKANQMSSWFKGEFWNFYDNGIELISIGGKAIFDRNGYWSILDWNGDEREANENYKTVNFHRFLRIPYDFIVDYDLEADPYNGCPSIYVKYEKDNMPYEEILCGTAGIYDETNEFNSRQTYYFDNTKKTNLV